MRIANDQILQPGRRRRLSPAWLLPILLVLISMACQQTAPGLTPAVSPAPGEQTLAPPPATQIPESEIIFQVEIPANSPPDEPVYLNILDEVGGLALNMLTYPMDQDDPRHYVLSMPLPLGSAVKYRYSRQAPAAMVEEHVSDGRQMRYRLYHVEGPGTVQDVVTRWTDTKFEGPTGRISGQALDAQTGQPITNLLIIAGGAQALTASDGSYLLEGLPPGTHNLVAYALDGSYRTFQQGAMVASDSTTPAELRLTPAKMVNIIFNVSVPADTIPAVPIRLAGNLYQLGNTFGDLSGGVNTVASRMPVLSPIPEGGLAIQLSLPAGADLRYLYTLGDGYWNAELNQDGSRHVRQLIVPETDTVILDRVESWLASNTGPITFDVNVPAYTPPEDFISIQFNPLFGWTEPIPMWKLGNNRWVYVLNSPLQTIGSMSYRYCRNDQCGAADDAQTMGPTSGGFPINSGLFSQTVEDDVTSWAWLDPNPIAAAVDPVPVLARGSLFIAGIEYQPGYHPTWKPRTAETLNSVQSTGANWVFITPTWTYTRTSPPILEIVSGRDAPWLDLQDSILQARQRGLSVAINPSPRFPTTADQWWSEAKRDFAWWVVWFERYRAFALHHADLAARSDAQALVLGGNWLSPAMPGGVLANGSPSGVPADAELRWRNLIQEVRSHYSGPIIWALPYSQAANNPPVFLDAVDRIHVLFSPQLTTITNAGRPDLQNEAGRLLDAGVQPLQARFGKAITIGLAYPSAEGAATACLPNPAGGCLGWFALSRPQADIATIAIDLGEQADIYNAVLGAVNTRAYITGVVSQGFYPPVTLQDKSSSIRGKPAQEVLKYWFPRLLAVAQ
jgi:hypothetical protein